MSPSRGATPVSSKRQCNLQRGARAGPARELERAAGALHELARKVEPEPGALRARGEERLADAGEHVGWDPRALVGDRHPGASALDRDRDADTSAIGRGLERVLEQVQPHLLE